MTSVQKVVFVGDGGVGKTSFISKLIEGSWNPQYYPTLGVEVHRYNNYVLWDVAGQEKYSLGYETIFENADKIVFCYDSTSLRSLKNFKFWKAKFPENVPVIFLRMKCDIANKHKVELGTPTSVLKNINIEFK